MQIVDTKLKFGALKLRISTKRVIIHHSDSDFGDAATIHQWHLNKGWSGIGYHYVIKKDGTIEKGRPSNTIGAHSGEKGNVDSIGICLVGNFMETVPTKEQMDSLVWLINYNKKIYGKLAVIGHKDVMATACPGKLFPWTTLKKRLEEGTVEQWKIDIMKEAEKKGIVMPNVHAAEETAEKWFVLAVALNVLKELKKDEN